MQHDRIESCGGENCTEETDALAFSNNTNAAAQHNARENTPGTLDRHSHTRITSSTCHCERPSSPHRSPHHISFSNGFESTHSAFVRTIQPYIVANHDDVTATDAALCFRSPPTTTAACLCCCTILLRLVDRRELHATATILTSRRRSQQCGHIVELQCCIQFRTICVGHPRRARTRGMVLPHVLRRTRTSILTTTEISRRHWPTNLA